MTYAHTITCRCDHRGVSYDPRMLHLLQDILGLNAQVEPALQQSRSERIQSEGEQMKAGLATCSDRCASSAFCAIQSKIGCHVLNTRRTRSRWVIWIVAVLSLMISICVLWYAFADESYDSITRFNWAHFRAYNSDGNQVQDFEMGVFAGGYQDYLSDGTAQCTTTIQYEHCRHTPRTPIALGADITSALSSMSCEDRALTLLTPQTCKQFPPNIGHDCFACRS